MFDWNKHKIYSGYIMDSNALHVIYTLPFVVQAKYFGWCFLYQSHILVDAEFHRLSEHA